MGMRLRSLADHSLEFSLGRINALAPGDSFAAGPFGLVGRDAAKLVIVVRSIGDISLRKRRDDNRGRRAARIRAFLDLKLEGVVRSVRDFDHFARIIAVGTDLINDHRKAVVGVFRFDRGRTLDERTVFITFAHEGREVLRPEGLGAFSADVAGSRAECCQRVIERDLAAVDFQFHRRNIVRILREETVLEAVGDRCSDLLLRRRIERYEVSLVIEDLRVDAGGIEIRTELHANFNDVQRLQSCAGVQFRAAAVSPYFVDVETILDGACAVPAFGQYGRRVDLCRSGNRTHAERHEHRHNDCQHAFCRFHVFVFLLAFFWDYRICLYMANSKKNTPIY